MSKIPAVENAGILIVVPTSEELAAVLNAMGFMPSQWNPCATPMEYLHESLIDSCNHRRLACRRQRPGTVHQMKVNRSMATPFGHELPENTVGRSGIDLFLRKPIHPDALVRAITRSLRISAVFASHRDANKTAVPCRSGNHPKLLSCDTAGLHARSDELRMRRALDEA
jgi:hypothetical protein